MHQSAIFYGQRFFETYCADKELHHVTVVEIGSQDVNGSLREVCPSGVHYIGLDFVEGNGVDIIIDDPYKLPLLDASADIIVSSSCFVLLAGFHGSDAGTERRRRVLFECAQQRLFPSMAS